FLSATRAFERSFLSAALAVGFSVLSAAFAAGAFSRAGLLAAGLEWSLARAEDRTIRPATGRSAPQPAISQSTAWSWRCLRGRRWLPSSLACVFRLPGAALRYQGSSASSDDGAGVATRWARAPAGGVATGTVRGVAAAATGGEVVTDRARGTAA